MTDREFWEKCGFTMEKSTVEGVDTWYTSFYPDGTRYMQTEEEGLIHLLFPPITLDNLFKWAVPKLIEMGIAGSVLYPWLPKIIINKEDPAPALKKAIEEVL